MTKRSPYTRSSFMDLAFEQAEQAWKNNEVPIGCALVLNTKILAVAYNQTISLQDPTAHAEILAIRRACQRLGLPYLEGADLYVTLEPCCMCAATISRTRLRRIYYASFDPKAGCLDHAPFFFALNQAFHKPDVYGGLSQKRGEQLLQNFFQEKRKSLKNIKFYRK